jgi:hypothetical protein
LIYGFVQATIRVLKRIELPSAGVSDVRIRSDSKLFASAGWDKRFATSASA